MDQLGELKEAAIIEYEPSRAINTHPLIAQCIIQGGFDIILLGFA